MHFLYSIPFGEELHMSGAVDLSIDTEDDLLSSCYVFSELHLSRFGIDSITKFCLRILIRNLEQCNIAHSETRRPPLDLV